ncbi:alpha/beta-hydrolase [Meira miltonrushii]|uniref:Prolyl endopeptidase n=1 Tax=Meira miltonrushii TaxID=1280837 RepID=A0A316VGR0_9BASI|nr:alpha/beta-hydrolase [Meira miltonrushii]PWN36837.1 alpha/beta-hydrolase [Meira miltonrushii]
MNKTIFLIFLVAQLVHFVAGWNKLPYWSTKETPFPNVRRVNKTWSYRSAKANGNVTLKDPYFWLEEPIDTPEVKQFIDSELSLTEKYMAKCKNYNAISQSIRDVYDYDEYGKIYYGSLRNRSSFYTYTLRLANENLRTFYIASPEEIEAAKQNNFAKPPGKKFLSESLLSENGTATIKQFAYSDTGLFVYYVVETDAYVGTWYVRTLDSVLTSETTKKIVPGGDGRMSDVIPSCDGGFSWNNVTSGFFYSQINDPRTSNTTDVGSKIRFHKIGTPYEKDITIVQPDTDAGNYWSVDTSDDGKWLVVWGYSSADSHAVAYATCLADQELSEKMKWFSVSPSNDYMHDSVGILDDYWYFKIDKDAIDHKVVKVKLDASKARQVSKLRDLTDRLPMIEVIPTRRNSDLYFTSPIAKNKAAFVYTEKGQYVVYIFELSTGKQLQKLQTGQDGNLNGVYSTGFGSDVLILKYSTTVSPFTFHRIKIDQSDKVTQDTLLITKVKNSNPEDYITEALSATSADGTKVPYFIIYNKKQKKRTGTLPCWLHFYGFYGFLENLNWEEKIASWLFNYEGVVAFAGVRGGGDNGQEWHLAGARNNRQKTWDDIIAVAQEMVKQKICAPDKVIAHGSSGGGLAATVAAQKAPVNTFGAILADSAPVDWLSLTRSFAGSFQISEFGDPYNSTDFDQIISWDPYLNVNPKKPMPPILLTTGGTDDIVSASNTFKFLALIQYSYPNSTNPLLMQFLSQTGHNTLTNNVDIGVNLAAHQHCFLQLALGIQRRN